MRMYYYKCNDLWLSCRARSKAEVAQMYGDQAEEILTEREAEKRAFQGDEELSDYIQSTYFCALMCN